MTMLLEIRGLNTYYGESHILRDVDLTVKKGEMVSDRSQWCGQDHVVENSDWIA